MAEPMNPEEFAHRMKELAAQTQQPRADKESLHLEIDSLMGKVLRSLGYGEGIDALEDAILWYA